MTKNKDISLTDVDIVLMFDDNVFVVVDRCRHCVDV